MENLAYETYNFIAGIAAEPHFDNDFNEIHSKLEELGLSHEATESITDLLTSLNYKSFEHGFKSACAVDFLKGGAIYCSKAMYSSYVVILSTMVPSSLTSMIRFAIV